MKRSPRLSQGFTRTLNPKLERFITVNPTAVELIRKKPSLGPQNGEWLKRALFILNDPSTRSRIQGTLSTTNHRPSKVLTNQSHTRAGRGHIATSQHHHTGGSGQQTLRHEVAQA